jgi:hypothetical protein
MKAMDLAKEVHELLKTSAFRIEEFVRDAHAHRQRRPQNNLTMNAWWKETVATFIRVFGKGCH